MNDAINYHSRRFYNAQKRKARAAAPVGAVKGLVEDAYIAGAMAVHENYVPCRNPDFSEAATDYASFVVPALDTTAPADPLADERVLERVAAALWKAQVVDAGSPQGVIDRRTPEAFAEAGDDVRGKWLKLARAALAAIEAQP